jgi:hypothetical protein
MDGRARWSSTVVHVSRRQIEGRIRPQIEDGPSGVEGSPFALQIGVDLMITNRDRLLVCSDADGGLRISPSGELDDAGCQRLNEAIIGALRSGAPRVEIDLRDSGPDNARVRRVLRAGESLARHLAIEYRVSGRRAS